MDQGFKNLLQDLFIDPESQESLNPYYGNEGSILGLKTQSGRLLPVVDHVIDFVGSNNYASNFGDQWTRFPNLQLDSSNKTSISLDRFSAALGDDFSHLRGKLVLDVGCGTGRFAEIALRAGAYVVALDYSDAAKVAANNLKHYPNFVCLQANIYDLPFVCGKFDVVYCLGVLQHTPDVEKAFKSLPIHVKPSGKIIVDYYWKRLRSLIGWKYPIRLITSRIHEDKVLKVLTLIHPVLYLCSDFLIRTPIFGALLARLIPVVNYRLDHPELNDSLLKEFSLLDTYDNWAPRYDSPQTPNTIKRWASEAGLSNIEVEHVSHLCLRATK